MILLIILLVIALANFWGILLITKGVWSKTK